MEAADKDFNATAKQLGLKVAAPVTAKAMDEAFGPLGNQRSIIRWAFDKETSEGDVKRFEIANVGHVIAQYKSENKSGLVSVTLARPYVEPILKNKKKAEILKAKMTGSSIEAIAKSAGVAVQQATNVTMDNPVLPGGVGQEPKVVGNAFALSANKVSAPIEGNTGVYVVKNISTVKAPAIANHAAYVAKLKAQSTSDASRILPALKTNAKIEDNRLQFNY